MQNAAGDWIAARYVPESFVINIGDLMSRWTNGLLVATHHRVRRVIGDRISVPFFFEPNVDALITPIDWSGGSTEKKFEPIEYGQFVRQKMATWVEYQDLV